MMRRMTQFSFLALVVLGCTSCQHTRHVTVDPAPLPEAEILPYWPGVDSTVALAADTLAQAALISAQAREEGIRETRAALEMARLADNLLGTQVFIATPADNDTADIEQRQAAITAFNDGAQSLTKYSEEVDSLRAAELLETAAGHFAAALKANPFDEDAHFWLARVYELQADALGQAGATDGAIAVLQKLVSMQGHRPGYIALLAEAHERHGTPASALAAGALWQRAAEATIDNAVLDPDGRIAIDSAAAFTHFARSSRAFVQAVRSDLALEALEAAAAWATLKGDDSYVDAERQWILWDEGNLETRVRFDALLGLASSHPENAAIGLEALLAEVESEGARLEVQHELALIHYRVGRVDEAVGSLQSLWATVQDNSSADTARHSRIREDFGVMAFNIGMAHRAEGDLRGALGYLMQSEATGFSQFARAALEGSHKFKLGIGELLWRWTLVSTIPFQSYEPLTACFGEG